MTPFTLALLGLSLFSTRLPGRPPQFFMKVVSTGKGFGVEPKARGTKKIPVVHLDSSILEALATLREGSQSLTTYLNSQFVHDSKSLLDIGRRLQAGEVVVLKVQQHQLLIIPSHGYLLLHRLLNPVYTHVRIAS